MEVLFGGWLPDDINGHLDKLVFDVDGPLIKKSKTG